ncbi:hypothetical protein R3P38DRAFT_3008164 [Favolaschia claudopus]|uniref:Uncharacterized protein n=1 Tax=Favolaschia claudopus TaxID=2862362 RepID=A0AAW0AJL0_9AGAR
MVNHLLHFNLDTLFASNTRWYVAAKCPHPWDVCDVILSWLKVERAPATLLKQWNDYFMLTKFDLLCQQRREVPERYYKVSQQEQEGAGSGKQFGSRLLQIVQAYIVLGSTTRLVHIKEILNYSWEELTESISHLRSSSDDESIELTELTELIGEAWQPQCIQSLYSNDTLHSIAKRCLEFATVYRHTSCLPSAWCFVVRACFPSQVLLKLLTEFWGVHENMCMHLDACHCHIQVWLQAWTTPPKDFLGFFQNPKKYSDRLALDTWGKRTGLGYPGRKIEKCVAISFGYGPMYELPM